MKSLKKLFMSSFALIAMLSMTTPAVAGDYIENGRDTITHRGTDGSYLSRNVVAKLYDVSERWVRDTVEYWDWESTYTPPNYGKSSGKYWKGFWNAPKEQKASKLAAAVKGIGKSTAEKILFYPNSKRLRNKYFTRLPRSWSEFKNLMWRISNDDSIGARDVYNNVIANRANAEANMRNLGYGSTGGESSGRWVRKTKTVWVKKQTKQFVRDLRRNVDVHVSGSKLLDSESEKIILINDGHNVTVKVDGYNSYSERRDDRNIIHLEATGRNAVRPATNDFSVSLVNSNGSLHLKLSDSKNAELSKKSANLSYAVTYTVSKKKGMCSKAERQGPYTKTLNDLSETIDVGQNANLEQGSAYFLERVSVERVGTDYFSGQSGQMKSAAATYGQAAQ